MADLAVIGIGVDTTDLQDGKAALNQFAVTGETTEKRMKSSMKGVSGSVKGVSTEAVRGSPGLRNFALQLGQVGQQGAVTGNYIQALAIQLPDMALGFGTVGALIGVAAAALTPLISGMASGADSAKVLEDAIDGLNDSLKGYRQAVDQAQFDSLIDTFGAITPEIIAMARELQELRIREIMLDAAEAARALGEQFEAGFFSTAEQQIKSALGVTIEQAERLEFLFRQIGNADTLADQIAAIDSLQAGILEATGGIENMDASQIEFYNSTLDAERALRAAEAAAGGVAGAMSGAADEAGRFAENAIAALNAANAQAARDQLVYGGRGADPRLFDEGGSRAGSGGRFTPSRATSGRGGGGGRSVTAADREWLELEREAERLIDANKTAADRYAESLANLNKLKAAGKISAEDYDQALAGLEKTTQRAADKANDFKSSFEDAFASIITGSKSAKEALSDLLATFASQLARQGISGLFSSLDFGGFFADGGTVRPGTWNVVGENGPEIFVPGSGGTIIPNGGMGGGGVSISIDARGAEIGAAERIRDEVRRMLPEITRASVGAVGQAKRRGVPV